MIKEIVMIRVVLGVTIGASLLGMIVAAMISAPSDINQAEVLFLEGQVRMEERFATVPNEAEQRWVKSQTKQWKQFGMIESVDGVPTGHVAPTE
jgi:hypothetical protein